MTVRVGINGFGRIGRNFLRAAAESAADIEIVAINDLLSPEINAHLLHYDSSYRRFPGSVEVKGSDIVVDGRVVRVFAERDPAALRWGELGVEVVVESTGRFTKREAAAAHLAAGAKRVVISAPSGDADATFVIGVNEADFDPAKHFVISNASCTTNCFVPMVKVLDDAFGVDKGLMTTVHAYTNDQELLDLARDNLRRARAAAINIVPTSTGAARATNLVMANMKGRLDGSALRVPVPVGSITDFTGILSAPTDAKAVNAAFAAAAKSGPLSKVLVYTEDPIVSSDIVGSSASCTFDSGLTLALPLEGEKTLVKVFGWYDNEWGYSHRLVELVALVGS
ncbi:MAG TPA: type I glyceraldehyde-3-phosphate dehydrogenase [Acidimicrobiales bacterium]|nr:type I glyceraldehyde-3-phosphate dehydrogenase [Acidimicrobiales bacterium]